MMFVDKIIIYYDDPPLEVSQTSETSLSIAHGESSIEIIPDELREIIEIARLIGWEGV